MHVTAQFHGSFVTISEANATTIDGIFGGLDCDDGPGGRVGFDGRLLLTKQQKLRVPFKEVSREQGRYSMARLPAPIACKDWDALCLTARYTGVVPSAVEIQRRLG
jgi:hypothetical protein